MDNINRPPALWCDCLNHSREEWNLSCYEIMPNESLHDYTEILKAITEIQDFFIYQKKKEKTTKILRFCNTIFLHTL